MFDIGLRLSEPRRFGAGRLQHESGFTLPPEARCIAPVIKFGQALCLPRQLATRKETSTTTTHEDGHDWQSDLRCGIGGPFAIACFTAPANAAPYDGSWKMSLVTTDGHCGVISVALAIRGGAIASTSGKFVMRPIHIVGRVSGSGH